jgi:hypothetical protein
MRRVTVGTVPNCLCNFIKKRDGKCSEFHQLLQRTLAEKKWAVPTIRQPVKKEIRSGNESFFYINLPVLVCEFLLGSTGTILRFRALFLLIPSTSCFITAAKVIRVYVNFRLVVNLVVNSSISKYDFDFFLPVGYVVHNWEIEVKQKLEKLQYYLVRFRTNLRQFKLL